MSVGKVCGKPSILLWFQLSTDCARLHYAIPRLLYVAHGLPIWPVHTANADSSKLGRDETKLSCRRCEQAITRLMESFRISTNERCQKDCWQTVDIKGVRDWWTLLPIQDSEKIIQPASDNSHSVCCQCRHRTRESLLVHTYLCNCPRFQKIVNVCVCYTPHTRLLILAIQDCSSPRSEAKSSGWLQSAVTTWSFYMWSVIFLPGHPWSL